MEWTKFLILLGLFLDIVGVIKLIRSNFPKRFRKLSENPQPRNSAEEDFKGWKQAIYLILGGFLLQFLGTLFGIQL